MTALKFASIFTERNDSKQKTETFAYVKQTDGKYAKQMIEVGVSDLNYAEIKEDLKGDEVSLEKPDDENILDKAITLDGEKVEETKKEDPLVAKYDKNGNGKLDMDEIMDARDKMTEEEKTALREKMRERFGSGRPGGSGRPRGSGRPGGSGGRPGSGRP